MSRLPQQMSHNGSLPCRMVTSGCWNGVFDGTGHHGAELRCVDLRPLAAFDPAFTSLDMDMLTQPTAAVSMQGIVHALAVCHNFRSLLHGGVCDFVDESKSTHVKLCDIAMGVLQELLHGCLVPRTSNLSTSGPPGLVCLRARWRNQAMRWLPLPCHVCAAQ